MVTRLRVALFVVSSLIVGGLWACGSEELTGPAEEQRQHVASVVVTPNNSALASIGDTVRLSATALDESGNGIPLKKFTWYSSNQYRASVSASGLVTAVHDGSATITATADRISGSASVTVAQTATRVRVSPTVFMLAVGDVRQFHAEAVDANGHGVSGKTYVWSSSDENVVTVDASGRVAAVGLGETTIAAETGELVGYALIRVKAFAAVSAGEHTTCGVMTDGSAYCWGENAFNQLGDGTTTS